MDKILGLDGKPLKKKRLPSVLIGVPCGLQTFVAFEDSLQSTLYGNGEQFLATIGRAVGHITSDGRNAIVKRAVAENYDYVMFFDSDMIFPAGTILKLLKRCAEVPADELPIISGVYNTRSDHRINVYNWLPDVNSFEAVNTSVDPDFKLGGDKLYKADAVGTGCMLIDCSVFDEIQYPWFKYPYWPTKTTKEDMENLRNFTEFQLLNDIKSFKEGKYHYQGFIFDETPMKLDVEDIDDRIRELDKKLKPLKVEWWSEDIEFCKKCYDKGIHMYVDTRIVCKHILPSVVLQVSGTEFQVETIMGTKY